ncbi:MAG: LytTR family DNA-binding domain-containing protein [Spirochaetota bacterium]
MTPTRTILADDEQPSRERLRLALAGYPGIEIIAEAANGAQALELIRSLRPQLVFLDIQMPLMTGLEVLRQLKARPSVIFITAYDEYALRAFEVHALDYLLKPFSKERLYDALDHAIGNLGRNADGDTNAKVDRLVEDHIRREPYISRLSIKQGRAYRVLPVRQVDFLKAEDGLVFWVEGQDRHLVDETLVDLETRLDPAQFMRVHRNALVNIDAISRVIALGRGRLTAEFLSGQRVDIGRSHQDAFRKAMSLHRSSFKNHRSHD